MQTSILPFSGLMALLFILSACGHSHEKSTIASDIVSQQVPSLEVISGDWVAADTVAMEPSLRNFGGQAVANRDITSISWFASAPYSGGYHTGTLKINGQVPEVRAYRWQPFQTLRKSALNGYELLSSTRMVPDENIIMWRVEIVNTTRKVQDLTVDIDLIGFISKYGGDWQWWYPYPTMRGMRTTRDDEVENIRKLITTPDRNQQVLIEELVNGKPTGSKTSIKLPTDQDILHSTKYSTELEAGALVISDHETAAVTAFGFHTRPDSVVPYRSGGTARWKYAMQPGEKKVIEYCMVFGDQAQALKTRLAEVSRDFDHIFSRVQGIWESRWEQLFTPANDLISGCFPVLETADTLAKRVYYTGPLTMLYLMNTHLPQHKRVILTGGPKWGATISFFWDNTEWSLMQALADPVRLKEDISSWIKVDASKHYGFDNFGGKGVGNAYSANYYALFQLIRSYITVTRDFGYLREKINGKTVLETLEHYATNWARISAYGKPGCTDEIYRLADFGDDEWNLLECVPTYKHIVPSFNAGYIWMMRETAGLYRQAGNEQKAAELNNQAAQLLQQLMKLYAGNGVWNCLYPNNKIVQVRHCLDFMFMGRFIPQDMPEAVKKEMIDFVDRELLTDHWMRAQSLQDSAAKNSDRPDHGPLGAYDGWPAATMDALVQFGQPQKALDFYRSVEPVTHEGSWAQAHELWGENKENARARVRIAERGWHARDAMAGIGMSQVMVKCFFGFNPDIAGNALKKAGAINLEGKLHHVLYGGAYYTLSLHQGQTKFEKEK